MGSGGGLMNRRELIAGVGSLGVLGGAGAVLWNGLPSFGDNSPGSADDESTGDPLEVETIDAQGSEAGSITVPDDSVMAIMFFSTGCGSCQTQMQELGPAREELADQYGDAVRVMSVTYQTPETKPEDELREWWTTHDGDWHIGYDSGLATSYNVVGFPVTIVVDTNGDKQWEENGVQSADRIVEAVESVLEAEAEAEDEASDEDTDSESDETSDETAATISGA